VTFEKIEKALYECKPGAKLIPCLWGDTLGAKLNADGASIPTYDKAQGGKKLTDEEENIRLWEALYKDPFYEICLLWLRSLQSQMLSLVDLRLHKNSRTELHPPYRSCVTNKIR
jgi:hypothetical protein